MADHISFDELQSFAFADKLTPEVLQIGSKIHAHILRCDDCAKQLDALLELRHSSERAIQNKLGKKDDLQHQRELIDSFFSDYHDKSDSSPQHNSQSHHTSRGYH